MIYHVIPRHDDHEHFQGSECPCEPDIELHGENNTLMIHHSFDGREALEEAEQILKDLSE